MRNIIIKEIKEMVKNAESYAAFVNAFMHYQEKLDGTNFFIVWDDDTDIILIGNIRSNQSTELDLAEEINALD